MGGANNDCSSLDVLAGAKAASGPILQTLGEAKAPQRYFSGSGLEDGEKFE